MQYSAVQCNAVQYSAVAAVQCLELPSRHYAVQCLVHCAVCSAVQCLELPRALLASQAKKGRPTRGAHKMIYGADFDFDQSRHLTLKHISNCVSVS